MNTITTSAAFQLEKLLTGFFAVGLILALGGYIALAQTYPTHTKGVVATAVGLALVPFLKVRHLRDLVTLFDPATIAMWSGFSLLLGAVMLCG